MTNSTNNTAAFPRQTVDTNQTDGANLVAILPSPTASLSIDTTPVGRSGGDWAVMRNTTFPTGIHSSAVILGIGETVVEDSGQECDRSDPPPKEWLRLPGDGVSISDFGTELGRALSKHGIFSRQGCAFALNREEQKFERIDPHWFRTWAEIHVTTYKLKLLGGSSSFSQIINTMSEDRGNFYFR